MRIRLLALALCLLASPAWTQPVTPAPAKRRVVVVIFDGMRPDFITEKHAPTLWKLRGEGVYFQNHHSIYPTATHVNGTAIATGAYPDRSGLMANREFRYGIRQDRPVDTSAVDVIERGDQMSEGKYLALPTVAEAVRAAGGTVTVAGSKSIAILQDRKADWTTALATIGNDVITVFAAAPLPFALRDQTQQLLGPFRVQPDQTNASRNGYVTRALTKVLWAKGVPDFSFLWLSEPDLAQHEFAPGSEAALAAIKSSDDNLATILRTLENKQLRESTNVFVVSDHGFSTITQAVDIPELLHQAGFETGVKFKGRPQKGQVLVVPNGGTSLFYVMGHYPLITRGLVRWLQRSDFAGVIFSREPMEGTFDLKTIRIETRFGPDVVVAMRWSDRANQFGVPGEIMADAKRGVGQGTHASLSKYDVHNILVAAGPDFRRGAITTLPSGNIDLAPTIFHLLNLKPAEKFDGRILSEALISTPEAPSARAETETLEATRDFPSGQWKQYLRISRFGDTTYFDEGNGAFMPK